MYPHIPPDSGTHQRTFAHWPKPLPTREKEKAGSSWELPALSVVPGAGIEPARLAAGDFESGAVSRIHADLRAICSASVRGNSPSET